MTKRQPRQSPARAVVSGAAEPEDETTDALTNKLRENLISAQDADAQDLASPTAAVTIQDPVWGGRSARAETVQENARVAPTTENDKTAFSHFTHVPLIRPMLLA
jgi:hypothetical protein